MSLECGQGPRRPSKSVLMTLMSALGKNRRRLLQRLCRSLHRKGLRKKLFPHFLQYW
jgi:hypothetical protein